MPHALERVNTMEPNKETAMQELPLYQCHKKVRALKIEKIATSADVIATDPEAENFDGALLIAGDRGVNVSSEYLAKHKPEVGGYYVLYEDGYESYSPAAPFEAGYSPAFVAECSAS